MAASESARQSAVHIGDEDPDAYVQASPGPARDSLPRPGRSATDLTESSRRKIAERWGKRIEEPPPQTPADLEDPSEGAADAFNQMVMDAFNQMHLYRDPTPSLKAVWLDLAEGGGRVYEDQGLMLAGLYWVAGAPGYAIVAACKVTETVCARPGRMYPALVVLIVLWIALAIAGLNPVPLSDLNPF